MAREKKPDGLIGLRLEISPEHRDRLLIASAKRGQSMAACLRQVVVEWIDSAEPAPVPSAKVSRPRKKKGAAE